MPVSQSDLNDIIASLFVAVMHRDGDRWRREVADAKAICTDQEQDFIWSGVQDAVARHRRNQDERDHPMRRQDAPTSFGQSGVRFKVDGIVERSLEALASRPRTPHYDLALADLRAAVERVPVREAELKAAEDDLSVCDPADQARLEKAVAEATHRLALARRSQLICLSKISRTTDPETGKKYPAPPGRAPGFLPGPEGQLEDEYAARKRLAAADAFMATGKKLPEEESAHLRWERLRFVYYIDCVHHQAMRLKAMPDDVIAMLSDHVLAFCLYVYREASKQGVPVVVEPSSGSVRVEHAIWRDRLTDTEFREVAEFLLFAGSRLQLRIHWDVEAPETYYIEPPTSGAVDYAHVIRGLKRYNWRHPNATDEDLFEEMTPGSERVTVSTPEFMAWMDAERAQIELEKEATERYLETGVPQLINGEVIDEQPEWIDPIPRLATTTLRSSLVGLFHKVRQFTKAAPARLSARSAGEGWYKYPSDYRVSVDQIAGELFDAIQTGDLDAAVWLETHVLARLDDDVVARGIAKTEKMILHEGGGGPRYGRPVE